MLKTNNLSKKLIYFVVFTLLLITITLHLTGQVAKADSANVVRKTQGNTYGDGCTYNGTLMNTVVFVEIVDQNGNNLGWSNNFDINISTSSNYGFEKGIVKHIDTKQAEWRKSVKFSPGGEGHYESCNLASINRSGMAKALNFTDQSHDVNEWKLSCGFSTLGGHNRVFDFTGLGVPGGIPGGYAPVGWVWPIARVSGGSDANFKNVGIHLKYKVKASWHIEGVSTIDGVAGNKTVTVLKGQPAAVTFKHTLTNKGPAKSASINGDVVSTNVSPPKSYLNTELDLPAGTARDFGRSALRTYNYSTNVAGSHKYCEHATFTPVNQDGGRGNTPEVCVTVNVVDPSPEVSGAINYEKGSGGGAAIIHKINIADSTGHCPAITFTWYIKGVSGNGIPYGSTGDGEPVTSTLGGTNCIDTVTKIVSSDWLDSQLGGVASFQTIPPPITGNSPTAPIKLTVYEVPFARFFGHDVQVCTAATNNRFMWDNRATNPDKQKGSFAGLASIFGTPVGTLFEGLHTSTPSFVRDSLDSAWAGQSCGSLDTGAPLAATSGSITLSVGKHYYTGTNISVPGGSLVGQVTIDATGNVTITGNITSTYGGGAINANTPTLLIKAKGSIFIDKGVTRIDGVLMAGQNIHTCTNGSTVMATSWLYPNCRNPLIINGAVSAGGKVSFERSDGTRFMAGITNTVPATTPAPGDNSSPAETFNFPAYLNFMPLNLLDVSKQGYDSYTVLPPRL